MSVIPVERDTERISNLDIRSCSSSLSDDDDDDDDGAFSVPELEESQRSSFSDGRVSDNDSFGLSSLDSDESL